MKKLVNLPQHKNVSHIIAPNKLLMSMQILIISPPILIRKNTKKAKNNIDILGFVFLCVTGTKD